MAKSRGVLIIILFFFGAIFALSGLVFTLQGFGIVGPTKSFMYQSQTWIYQGLGILALGLVVLGVAFFFRRRTNATPLPVSDELPEDQKKNASSA
jgi:hypothetical protein